MTAVDQPGALASPWVEKRVFVETKKLSYYCVGVVTGGWGKH
jgi:hypothetical protein